ncbi:hypothetical protein E4U54_008227 [Claviceps lovelessii]|nr:hypothetical protein E4U54_008227 [Claviceps lovelessii]
MSTRAMFSALRSLGCRRGAVLSGFAFRSHRTFSSTASNAVRAVFTETDNAELNSILQSIQNTIILPAHLPEKQREIVFDPKKRSFLEQNPIVIELDGLEHKFSPIDRFKGIDNSKKALAKALNNMHSADDWANLSTLLAGFKKARIKLKPTHWGKIVRLAGIRGHVYAIIECAKQSDKTGLFLKNPEVVLRVLAFVNDKISNSSGAAAESKQALTWVEMVLDLLQRPEHAMPAQQTRERLHYSPLVRGLVLYARASAANTGKAGERELDLLRDDVTLLTSLWQDAVGKDLVEVAEFAKLNPTLERNANPNGNHAPRALNGSAYIQVLAQNIKGVELAQQVLGQEAAEGLSPILKTLESHLQDFATTSEQRTDEWAKEYEKVMGKKPDWPAVGNKTVAADS